MERVANDLKDYVGDDIEDGLNPPSMMIGMIKQDSTSSRFSTDEINSPLFVDNELE